ncbi:glycoside hydrolase family 108 protein [Novosphingobium clariflavum]|uniref:Glycoside hydrolase family 108 protein n=1 Tax=Novosphingobium clariflavum TaxID=2029884 RepID=A0ABV6SAZ1_9SPHN|nr:glycosyl hydrolase 108 family protein [Novosphingobium clariflavum]
MAQEPTPNEITAIGYGPRYVAASDDVLGSEGGHVNDKLDKGGETNNGISLRFLASEGTFDDDGDGKLDFDLDMDGDIDGADIRLLTRGDARYLFYRCFWKPLDCESFARPIGEMLFDQGVNAGRTAAKKLLQRAVNTCLMEAKAKMGSKTAPDLLKVDGGLGEKSRAAIIWVLQYPPQGMQAIILAYRAAVRERYRNIVARYPSQQRFLRGWLARAERLGKL